jgi:GGDEF domain-containing protein
MPIVDYRGKKITFADDMTEEEISRQMPSIADQIDADLLEVESPKKQEGGIGDKIKEFAKEVALKPLRDAVSIARMTDNRSVTADMDGYEAKDTGFDKSAGSRVLKEVAQKKPETLKKGSKIVDGASGIAEVGLNKGYAGLGRIESGLLRAAGDAFDSDTLRRTADKQDEFAEEVENRAVLRGKKSTAFEPDSIAQEAPKVATDAIGSVITSAPAIGGAVLSGGSAIPAIFATSALSEYGAGREELNISGAAFRALGMGAAEALGEKLGGTDKFANALTQVLGGKNKLAELGAKMLTTGVKEIPSEEITTTAQFLLDKSEAFGLNKDATLEDYIQQVKDTAKVAAFQGAGMAGAGGLIKAAVNGKSQFKEPIQASNPSVERIIAADKLQKNAESEAAIHNITHPDTTIEEAIALATVAVESPLAQPLPIKDEAINAADILGEENVSYTQQGAVGGVDSGTVEAEFNQPSGSAIATDNLVDGLRPSSIGEVTASDVPAGMGSESNSALVLAEPDYSTMSYEKLQQAREFARTRNKELDIAAMRKYAGNDIANEAANWPQRKIDKWFEQNATAEMENESSAFKGINVDTIDAYSKAVNDFDESSPEALGKSIALKMRNIDAPDFVGSPEYVAIKNALEYSSKQGWNESEVINAVREKAFEYAGDDAPELFARLFNIKPGPATSAIDTSSDSVNAQVENIQTPAISVNAENNISTGAVEVAKIGGKNSKEAISVSNNGTTLNVLYNGEPLLDYETEQEVTLPAGATIDEIRKAVKGSGQFNKQILQFSKTYAPSVTDEAPAKVQAAPVASKKAQVNEKFVANKDVLRAWMPDMDWAVIGGRITRDADGQVSGRTSWEPKDYDLDSIRKSSGLSYPGMQKAVQKALDGKPLSKAESGAIDAMIEFAELIKNSSAEEVEAQQSDNATLTVEEEIALAQLEQDMNWMTLVESIAADDNTLASISSKAQNYLDQFNNEVGEYLEQITEFERKDEREVSKTQSREQAESDRGDGTESQRENGKNNQGQNQTQERRAAGVERVERREDQDTRKNVSDMSADEMRRALLIDDLTGIGNRRAYDESVKKPYQVSIDADGLKWINDNLGHESGDILLTAIGEAIGRVTTDSYHISGDEFVVQASTEIEAADVMDTVNELLAQATVEGVNSSGDKVTLKGIGISYGIAKDLKDAENKLQQHKSERETAGLRAGRGEQPANATITSQRSENNQDNSSSQDLLGQDTSKQQAVADAERAKDAKRNSGADNQDTFTLTGSNSEADKAAAAGAQDLFGLTQSDQSKIDGEIKSLRQQLQAVERDILLAAPSSMAVGGGDIESAMRSARVPKSLKDKRNQLRDRIGEINSSVKTIQDLGEKIGGARKDTSSTGGAKLNKSQKSDDDRPTWAKRFNIYQVAISTDKQEEGTWTITDSRNKDWRGQPKQIAKGFATKEAAEAELPAIAVGLKHRVYATAKRADDTYGYEIYRSINDRKRVKVVDKVFDDRMEALAYMGDHATEILETNTTFGETDLPTPEITTRIGVPRREGDVDGKDFMESFGLRGVEFGNWNNQIERQQLMNAAYDGLLDLAEVLNIPAKAIGLNGDLALAFGARGQGLSSAKAHYERSKVVINLTKMNGAGSLAHEWFHALDHYFARQGGQSPNQWEMNLDGTRSLKANKFPTNDFISSGFSYQSQMRPELIEAYKALMQTMIKKGATYVEDTVKADNFVAKAKEQLAQKLDSLRAELSAQKDVKYYKRKNAPASAEQLVEFDTVAAQLLNGDGLDAEYRVNNPDATVSRGRSLGGRRTNEALEKLSAIYKDVRGRSGFDSTNNHGVMDYLRQVMSTYSTRLKMLADAQNGDEKVKQVPTDFAMNARALDEGRGADYWTTPHEMAARAFQGYVEDKVKENGGSSPFMNYGRENAGILTPWGVQYPFPRGEERKQINAALDKFVGALKTKETEQGTALFSRSKSNEPLATQLQSIIDGDNPTKGKLLIIADNSPASLQMFGFDNLPVVTRTGADGVLKMHYEHGLNVSKLANVIENGLKRPAMILQHKGQGDVESLRFVTNEIHNGNPVILAIQPDKTNREGERQQLIATAFEVNAETISRAIANGDLLYRDTSAAITDNVKKAVTRAQIKYAREPRIVLGVIPNTALIRRQAYKVLSQSDIVKFETNNADSFFSRNNAPTFYSALSRAIDGIQTKKAPAVMWKGMIKNLSQKGVKPDEIEWTGVNEWLDLQKGSITKEQVQDYLNANGVSITETINGEALFNAETYSPKDFDSMPTDLQDLVMQVDDGDIDEDGFVEEAEALGYKVNMDMGGSVTSITKGDAPYEPTKYKGYVVDGGKNYKELLLSLPEQGISEEDYLKKYRERFPNSDVLDGEVRKFYQQGKTLPDNGKLIAKSKENYQSSHFSQANIVAHVRFDERTDADGNKVLFINEIQSDWAQEGKKKGFANESERERVSNEIKRIHGMTVDRFTSVGKLENAGVHPKLVEEWDKAFMKGGETPSAPFVTKTDAWVSLALKRMMRYAAENGFDKVSLINGEQAAGLYDLSKQVDSIGYIRDGDNTYKVWTVKDGKNGFIRENLTPQQVEDFVGKDIAKKIIDSGVRSTIKTLDGLDLKVGGEGMRSFYDSIVPKVAKDVLKKVGGNLDAISAQDKLSFEDYKKELIAKYGDDFKKKSSEEEFDKLNSLRLDKKSDISNNVTFTITPSMREQIMQGLPLFSKADASGGMAKADVTKIVDNLRAKWINAPQIVVVSDMNDSAIPEPVRDENERQLSQGADGQPEGFFYKKKVYVVASEMRNANDVQRVIFHETLGHYGLRGTFGTSLNKILNDVATLRRPLVAEKAKQYGLDMNNANDRLIAAEEVLAEMAQSNPQIGFVKRAIAAIRQWLRDNGFKLKLSDNDIIANYLLPARAYVEGGGKEQDVRGMVGAFSRSDQTQSEAFKKWFGDSKVVDADGKPLVVYRGDITPINEFKGSAFFGSKDVANQFADPQYMFGENTLNEGESPTVTPVYLQISRPKIFTREEQYDDYVMDGGKKSDTDWKSEGFDGVIYAPNGNIQDKNAYYKTFEPSQIKSAIGNNGNFDGNNNDIRFSRQGNLLPQWQSLPDSKLDSVIRVLQDKNIDLKRVVESIKKAGNDIEDRWNAYLQEELYHGRTAKRTQDFIKNDLEPLIEDMRMRGVSMADFEEYLWMRHAEERNIQIAKVNPEMPDGGSGVDTADAKAYLAALPATDKAKYGALASRVDLINRKSRQVLIDYGIESTDTIAAWEGAYKHYVPLMREDMDTGFGNGTGQGFSVKGNSTKRATGSNRAVVDIIANIAQQYEKNIIRGEKNRVSTALIGLAKLNPNDEFWKVDTPPTIKDINKVSGLVEERADPNYKNRDNVVVARIRNALGKVVERSVVFNEFDERAMMMAQSIKNLDQDDLGLFLGIASKFTRWFASVNTQYNPIFGFVNIVRDLQGSLINLSTTPIAGKKAEVMRNVLPALKGIYQDLRAQRNGENVDNDMVKLFEEFQNVGGQTGYRDMFANAKARSEALRNALDPTWWQDTKIGKVISVNGVIADQEQWIADKAIAPIFDWLSDFNTAFENAVRLSVYKVALENGQSKQQAASLGKNISVNFNRKGQVGRQMGSLFAFFNASVQGTARIGETLTSKDDNGNINLSKNGKRIVQGGLLLGVMQAFALAAAGYDEDEPPEFVKNRNLVIPLDWMNDIIGLETDDKYITIPMPLGFNAIPSIGRIGTEFIMSGGKNPQETLIKIFEMVMEVTNPVGGNGSMANMITPTAGDPFIDLYANKDWTGQQISRDDFSTLKPTPGFTRSRDATWDVSVALAKAINYATGGTDNKVGYFSPTADEIEYLVGQFTGGVGRETIKAGTTIESLVTGEELPTYKIPLLGRFYGDAAGQASQGNEFYNNITELSQHKAEIDDLRKNKGDVKQYVKNYPEAVLAKQSDVVLREVSNLRKRQRMLQENGADRSKVKIVEDRITNVMKKFNERVRARKEREAA